MKKVVFSIAATLFFAISTPVFADTQSDIDAYVQDIESGNLAKAEEKIRIALKNADAKYGALNPYSLTISYDLADILLLQNKAKESLTVIETIESALSAKPELAKSADLDSINFIHGLALSVDAQNDANRAKAAQLLKKSLLIFDGQERSDTYLLSAFLYLSDFSFSQKDYKSQLLYSEKAISEANRLFGVKNSGDNLLLARALYRKSIAVFQLGYSNFGFEGINPKNGLRMGINAGRDFAEYTYLDEALKLSLMAMEYYGSPKSPVDSTFYDVLSWQSSLASYFYTVKNSDFKISNIGVIQESVDKTLKLRSKYDAQGNYECRKYFLPFSNSILSKSFHSKYGFGSMVARISFNEKDEMQQFDLLSATMPEAATEFVRNDLLKYRNYRILDSIPQYCLKGFVLDLRFSIRN